MRTYYITEKKKKLALIIAAVLVFAAAFSAEFCRAGADLQVWVICQPGDEVNVRARATRKSESLGRLTTGDAVLFDGTTRDGFCRVKVPLEEPEGWIHAGYLSTEKPVDMGGALYEVRASGRVAARKYIHGPRRCWVVDGSLVNVYWMAGEWAVTSKGFIQAEYLEVRK